MVPFEPQAAPLEGLPFHLRDLEAAMEWAAAHSDARLVVATDYPDQPEAIEIYLQDSNDPRWCIWRDYLGHLHVDDWVKQEFDLPYPTLSRALGFISSSF
jgi:hypothetical protein